MESLHNNAIPEAIIRAAVATLPNPATCLYWTQHVDVTSELGVPCTIEFELHPCGCPDNTTWRWEAVNSFQKGPGK